jgi:hypothetical protein
VSIAEEKELSGWAKYSGNLGGATRCLRETEVVNTHTRVALMSVSSERLILRTMSMKKDDGP